MSEIIVFYKEVGKKPVLQKIENNIETFENMKKLQYFLKKIINI